MLDEHAIYLEFSLLQLDEAANKIWCKLSAMQGVQLGNYAITLCVAWMVGGGELPMAVHHNCN